MEHSLIRGEWAITSDELLTWKVLFARDGTLPREAQRRLLGAAIERDFHSHNGWVTDPAQQETIS